MKLILKIIAGLALLTFVAFGLAFYYLDSIVKEAVLKIGPEVTGTSIELEAVNLSLLGGSAGLAGLAIGNPQGYEQPNAFSLDEISVDLDLSSVREDVILIPRIYIEAPEIAYESIDGQDNFQALLENIAANTGASEEQEETTGANKKFIIEEFVLSNGLVSAKHELLAGKIIDIPLPNLRLTDIGRKTNGATAQEAATQIIEQISSAAMSAVTGSDLVQQAQQQLKALEEKARAEVDEKLQDAENMVEEKLNEAGLNEEQQGAIKGLLRGLGN